jgi:EAL domain-containing protein (putative c-di-GMP-specific phosphodiesterase class I)
VQRLGPGARPADEAILAAVVALGRGLDVRVVAEGVETREQMRAVSAAGVDAVQGFLLARPAPTEALPGLLRSLATGPVGH